MTRLILSLSMRADRMMVTTGQAKMMQRASGTSMKLTEAREQMTDTAAVRPAERFYHLLNINYTYIPI